MMAAFRADDLLGLRDLLRTEPGGYVPGDIKSGRGEEGGGDESDGKPKPYYAVQHALYVDILEGRKLSAGVALSSGTFLATRSPMTSRR